MGSRRNRSGRARGSSADLLRPPIGTHDGMAGMIERQALAAALHLASRPAGAAVLVVGHGSASAPGRALALHRHAARVASTALFAGSKRPAWKRRPSSPTRCAMLRAHPVVVIGFFANRAAMCATMCRR